MAMQYSKGLLECIADGMSSFSPVMLPELRERRPLIEALIKVGVVEALYVKLRPQSARGLRQALRRLDAARRSYSEMRGALNEYRKNFTPDAPNFGSYFVALDAAENCFIQIHISLDSIKNGLSDPIKDDSSSVLKRISSIAASIRHSGAQSNAEAQRMSLSRLPVYFVSDGVSNRRDEVSFIEVHKSLELLCDWTEDFASQIASINPLDPIMSFRHGRP
jgi:hypothetical protein